MTNLRSRQGKKLFTKYEQKMSNSDHPPARTTNVKPGKNNPSILGDKQLDAGRSGKSK